MSDYGRERQSHVRSHVIRLKLGTLRLAQLSPLEAILTPRAGGNYSRRMTNDCNSPLAAHLGVDDESASSLALLRQRQPRLAHYGALELTESLA